MQLYLFLLGVCGYTFMQLFFPEECQIAMINVSFYIILSYSRCEIYIKKLLQSPQLQMIQSYINSYYKQNDHEIEVIKWNETILRTSKRYLSADKLLSYDIIIFSDLENKNESQKINKVVFSGLLDFPLYFDYAVCNYTFIAVTVTLNEKTFSIKLSNERENYYVIGNKLNSVFICYLLKNQHNILCNHIQCTYNLTIFDHCANIINLTEKDEIILEKNNYSIVSHDTLNTK